MGNTSIDGNSLNSNDGIRPCESRIDQEISKVCGGVQGPIRLQPHFSVWHGVLASTLSDVVVVGDLPYRIGGAPRFVRNLVIKDRSTAARSPSGVERDIRACVVLEVIFEAQHQERGPEAILAFEIK